MAYWQETEHMARAKGPKIFLSHTRKDSDFCDLIDKAFARESVGAVRSEFEDIRAPGWPDLKKEIESCIAMFLVVGPELAALQRSPASSGWKYTQNWISWEIGFACARGIDVWIICDDDVKPNYPVPYFNNYVPFGLRQETKSEFLRSVITFYARGGRIIPAYFPERKVACPNDNCRIEFNLHTPLEPGTEIECPYCLNYIPFPKGFPRKRR